MPPRLRPRGGKAFPFEDIGEQHLQELIIEKLSLTDQFKFSLTSKTGSELMDSGHRVRFEVSLETWLRNFEDWAMIDLKTKEKRLMPCSQIRHYPNLRVGVFKLGFELALVNVHSNLEQPLTPNQRLWLTDVIARVSPNFVLDWCESWKEVGNGDVLKQFLEKKPGYVCGIMPPSILFPKWDTGNIDHHKAELWHTLRDHIEVRLMIDEGAANSFMRNLELDFLDGADTGVNKLLSICGGRSSVRWDQFCTGAVEGRVAVLDETEAYMIKKCYHNDCDFHARKFGLRRLPVWIMKFTSNSGKTAAVVKNLGWGNFCGYYYAFVANYEDAFNYFQVL